MKFLNKLLIVGVLCMMSVSCSDLTNLDLQDNPSAVTPERASVNDLYNNIQLTFANIFASLGGATGSHARMYHMGSFNYAAASSPTSFSGLWFSAYSNLFPDIAALDAIALEKGFDIHSGTAKIMKAYTLLGLVDVLNNVPLSQAGQGTDVISPTADSGESVYQAAIDLLDAAIGQMSGSSAPQPAFDNYYGGDVAKWITLANTLKLRAGISKRLVDPGAASSAVGIGDVIDSPDEDFQFNFGSQRTNPNSRHNFYNSHYEVGDGPYLSNYYMWLLAAEKLDGDNPVRDPRARYYFYRKVEKTAEQDLTTYSCHFSTSPDQSAQPDHWKPIDSRLPYCIATDDGYSGRDHGNGEGIPPDGPIRTSYGLYPAGGQFDEDSFDDTRQAGTTGGLGAGIYPIMLSSFVNFMKAEVAIAGGDAATGKTEMEAGIRASMAKVESFEALVGSTMSDPRELKTGETGTVKELFGLSAEKVDAYVNLVLAQYDAAGSDDERMDVAMKEYYIALWGNGLEAYNMYRRTGKPGNMQPTLEPASGEYTRSFFLPDVHVNRNANATQKSLTDRVFWDDGSANLY